MNRIHIASREIEELINKSSKTSLNICLDFILIQRDFPKIIMHTRTLIYFFFHLNYMYDHVPYQLYTRISKRNIYSAYTRVYLKRTENKIKFVSHITINYLQQERNLTFISRVKRGKSKSIFVFVWKNIFDFFFCLDKTHAMKKVNRMQNTSKEDWGEGSFKTAGCYLWPYVTAHVVNYVVFHHWESVESEVIILK